MQLKQLYASKILSELKKEFKIKNDFEVPKLEKIIVNIGVADPSDPKARKQAIANIVDQFATMTGQKPVVTVAHKSIANFKLRKGDPLGVKVTLRGKRMWGFIEKLIAVALPRVKDFRGVPTTAFDHAGNYSLGIEEQIIFPEINYDKIERIRSFQVVIVTSTKSDEKARRLLELLGMPFEKKE